MTAVMLKFRGPLVALVALLLTTSVAFAGQPTGTDAPRGHGNGANHGGKTVSTLEETTETDESSETETETDESSETETETETEAGDSAEGDNCATDPTGLTEDQLAEMTHGSVVCWAAHQDTPDGYANHGAWVSQWAHAGKDAKNAKAKGKGHKAGN